MNLSLHMLLNFVFINKSVIELLTSQLLRNSQLQLQSVVTLKLAISDTQIQLCKQAITALMT